MKRFRVFLKLMVLAGCGGLAYLLFHPELFVVRSDVQENGSQVAAEVRVEQLSPKLTVRPTYRSSIDCAQRTPQALTLAGDQLVVAYRRLNLVDFFDDSGQRLAFFDPFPKGELNIAALHVDSQDQLYVSDLANRTVMVFDDKRKFLHFFPSGKEAGAVRPLLPVGISGNGKLLVVADLGDNTVKTYLPRGEFVQALSQDASGQQGPWHPFDVALTDDGRILVSDIQGKQILAFSCAGKFVYDFADPETGSSPQKPGTMALDSLGRVHLVDSGSHRIFVYDNFGRFLFTYGGVGTVDKGMRVPAAIAIDTERNLVYIADSGNRQVDVWSLP
jgi:DNA-binding beta-propeller fold protein YncE